MLFPPLLVVQESRQKKPPPADPSFLRTDLPILDLTLENVEIVLDEMRPFLQADGGDVSIDDIDGPVVKLQLEGACGTCPSSTQTMKMGLERRLKERIPEIQEVVQVIIHITRNDVVTLNLFLTCRVST